MQFDFKNKEVLITGANRGIGLGLAKAFLQAGAELTIVAREADTIEVAESLSDEFGRKVKGYQCDIKEIEQVDALAQNINDSMGQVDVLINNAGLELITPITDPSVDIDNVFRDIILINVVGTFSVTRKLLEKIPQGGRIINTASMWGKTGVAEFSAYCASKHAVVGLTRSLAQELAPRSIAVNCVCPGWVRTEASLRSLTAMSERSGRAEDELLDEIIGAQAFGGLMEPADMADIYLFLASAAARNITGQAYTVDRGELMQ